MNRRSSFLALIVVILWMFSSFVLQPDPVYAALSLEQSFNWTQSPSGGTENPGGGTWMARGWEFTSASSYTLTHVKTKLVSSPFDAMVVRLYASRPTNPGAYGSPLASAPLISEGGSVWGGNFTPGVSLNSGTSYFIAFEAYITSSPSPGLPGNYAASGSEDLGTSYSGTDDSGSGGTSDMSVSDLDGGGENHAYPIFALYSETPPTVSISAPSQTSLRTGNVTFEITYTDASSITLASGDVSVNAAGTVTYGSVTVSNSGPSSRTVTVPVTGGDGSFTISLSPGTASNAGGSALAAGPSASVSVDNMPPTVPSTPDMQAASDSGTSSTDNITKTTTPTFVGTTDAGATVYLYRAGSTLIGSTTADGSGNWSITSATLPEGSHSITARSEDALGNQSTASAALDVTIDTSINIPVVTDFSDDTGTSATDNVTNDTMLLIHGTSDPNATIEVFRGGVSLGITYANGTGNWTFDATWNVLLENTYAYTAVASDTAGNSSVPSSPLTVVVDLTGPAAPTIVSITTDTGTSATDGITNDTTLLINGIALANSTVNVYRGGVHLGFTVSDGAGNWTFDATWNTLSEAGYSYTARVLDSAGNPSVDSAAFPVVIDTTAPTVAITPVTPTPRTTAVSSITIAFSEVVNSFDVGDFTLTRDGNLVSLAGATLNGSGDTYTLDNLSGITGSDGAYILTVNTGGGIQDTAGNALLVGSSTNWLKDATGPTTAISTTASNPTGVSPIPVTVVFSEAVVNFAAGDVLVTNATVANFAGSGTTYTFDLVPTAQGEVTAQVPAGVAQDAVANGNSASTVLTVTFDSQQPTVSISSTAAEPTNVSPIPITITFSKSVTGFDQGGITLTGGTLANFSGSGAVYTFDLTPTGQGVVTVAVPAGVAQDSALNSNLASSMFTRTFDSQQPSVAIDSTASDPTNVSPIPVTVVFSEPVVNFAVGDVLVTNASVINFSGSGANYSFGLLPAGIGVVTASIPAEAAQDSAGNNNTASATLSRTFDSDLPTVVLNTTAPDPTTMTVIPVSVTFSKPVTGFEVSDLAVTNATASNFTGSGTSYTFDLTPAANGLVTVQVPAGVASDAAANPNLASAVLTRTYGTTTLNTIVIDVTTTGGVCTTTVPNPAPGFTAVFSLGAGSPAWASIDSATGVFNCTLPASTAAGNYSIVVIIETSNGQTFMVTIQIVAQPTVSILPTPPETPLCENHNFAEGGVVRSSTVEGIDYAINCRVLYQNGTPTQWLGGDLYNAGSIGIQGVLDLGVQQAVDIFSPTGLSYFNGGAVFCLRGTGSLIWMAASGVPRHAEIIGSYTVPEFPGFTCATLFEPGTLVLVTEDPLQ